jgi:predicted metal-dependent peptidase
VKLVAEFRQPVDKPLILRGEVKLKRAVGILLRAHPFHGHIAAGWRVRPDLSLETMGVCWSCGSVQLLWNPHFVDGISDTELAGVLTHEVNHVVMRHPFLFPEQAKPTPNFDSYAALVAEEVTVNEFVALPLPGNPLLLADFAPQCPALQPMQSTRERYRLLYDAARARRHHEAQQKLKQSLENLIRDLLKKGVGKDPDVASHAGWESFRTGGAAAALAVSVATAQAINRHGQTLSPELRQLIQAAHATLGGPPGSTAGGMLETLAGTARARLSWQSILRRLLAVGHDAEPTYQRPPRRFPDLVGVLPGSRRVPTRLKILAAIDTSGSMSSDTLDEIAAELRVMARAYDVSVVEFDAKIQRRYRLAGPSGRSGLSGASELAGGPGPSADPLRHMQGRGGTDFHPLFKRDTLAWAADGGELSGVVVFTDGFGPAPDRGPREQVIWVLMGNGVRQPAPWGAVVSTDASATPSTSEPSSPR